MEHGYSIYRETEWTPNGNRPELDQNLLRIGALRHRLGDRTRSHDAHWLDDPGKGVVMRQEFKELDRNIIGPSLPLLVRTRGHRLTVDSSKMISSSWGQILESIASGGASAGRPKMAKSSGGSPSGCPQAASTQCNLQAKVTL